MRGALSNGRGAGARAEGEDASAEARTNYRRASPSTLPAPRQWVVSEPGSQPRSDTADVLEKDPLVELPDRIGPQESHVLGTSPGAREVIGGDRSARIHVEAQVPPGSG